ncbi:MAG: lytic transglycosylase domain-containing protein [Proteobacteria bacterium]|nr:lytic transglycosylase domain-containing protein [Pseudomonadota bacterium]
MRPRPTYYIYLRLIATMLLSIGSEDSFAISKMPRPFNQSSAKGASKNVGVPKEFETDPYVRKQIRFWESVFQKFEASSVIIHDVDEPLAMVDVIDFGRFLQKDGSVTRIGSADQTELVKRYIQRYDLAVERFQKRKEAAVTFGAIERRLLEVYQRDPQTLARLYSGNVHFRGQAGLSDTFLRAAQRAQEYLPYMENTFRNLGLPTQLTRLPFVESMFNLSAKSKVGASGIWQFMPNTAREYMSVNSLVDERNSPYKATTAAGLLLQTNFRELGAWPLAITAYNHGRGGMLRATRELGTTQLGTIITNYKSPSFGFASKNFYAEFMAAASTYDLLMRRGKILPINPQPAIAQVVLSKPTSIKVISEKTKLTFNQLALLNPCINASTFSSRTRSLLPQNYVLRLSKDGAKSLRRVRIANSTPQQSLKIDRTEELK